MRSKPDAFLLAPSSEVGLRGFCEIPLPSTGVHQAAGEEHIHHPASIRKSFFSPALQFCSPEEGRSIPAKGRNGVLKGYGTSVDGEPAPKQIRTLLPKELPYLLFAKSYIRSYIMQLFIEPLYEKKTTTTKKRQQPFLSISEKSSYVWIFQFEAQFQNLQRKQASPDRAEYQ